MKVENVRRFSLGDFAQPLPLIGIALAEDFPPRLRNNHSSGHDAGTSRPDWGIGSGLNVASDLDFVCQT